MDICQVLHRRSVHSLILATLWLSQCGSSQTPVISNVRFEVQDSIVLVHYDVLPSEKMKNITAEYPLENEYSVELLLRKESDQTFLYRPEKVSGDVGIISAWGNNKTIVWNILEELPGGVDDADFYFEIQLHNIDTGTPASYMLLSAGAVLAATSIVTYFIILDEQNKDSPPGKFPLPPGRPK